MSGTRYTVATLAGTPLAQSYLGPLSSPSSMLLRCAQTVHNGMGEPALLKACATLHANNTINRLIRIQWNGNERNWQCDIGAGVTTLEETEDGGAGPRALLEISTMGNFSFTGYCRRHALAVEPRPGVHRP